MRFRRCESAPDVALELTRSGWRNPLGQRRSELQRVAYVAARRDAVSLLLERARSRRGYAARRSGVAARRQRRRGSTPSTSAATSTRSGRWSAICRRDPSAKLAAIQMRFTVAPFGEVTRLWDVPPPFTAPAPAGRHAMTTRTQHGVALISILLIVALVTALMYHLMTRQALVVAQTRQVDARGSIAGVCTRRRGVCATDPVRRLESPGGPRCSIR